MCFFGNLLGHKTEHFSWVPFFPFFRIFLLFSFLGLVGCSGKDIPDWVENPYSMYDIKRFVVGVGVGYSKESADESARAEILKQIKVKIKEEFEEKVVEKREEGRTETSPFFSEEAQRIAKAVVSGEIQGIIIKERFFDESERKWYSLAVFDRSAFTKRIKRELADIDSQILLGVKRAKEFLSSGDVVRAIEVLESQRKRITEFHAKSMLLRAIGEYYPPAFEMLLEKISHEISSSLKIKTYGRREYQSPFTQVSFKINFLYNGIPVRNLPFSVGIKGLFSEKKFSFVSGENGEAHVKVFVPLRAGSNLFHIKPDLPYVDAYATFEVFVNPLTFFVKGKGKIREVIENCISKNGFHISEKGYVFVVEPELTTRIIHRGKDFAGKDTFISSAELTLNFKRGENTIFSESFTSRNSGSSVEEANSRAIHSLMRNICD